MKLHSIFLILQFVCLFGQLLSYFVFDKPELGKKLMYANLVFCAAFFFSKFVLDL